MKKIISILMLFIISTQADELKKIYYDDSNTSVKYTYPENMKTKTHYIITKYYKSGKKEYIETYKNGLRNGIKVVYYENGNVKYKIPFEFGRINGYLKSYYPDGEKRFTTLMHDNKFDSYTKIYDTDKDYEKYFIDESINFNE